MMMAPAPRTRRAGHRPAAIAAAVSEHLRGACGVACAWLAGLPRRAGRRIHAVNDAEAPRWNWLVTERRGGLVRQYRDARFVALRHDPALRRHELRDDAQNGNGTQPPAGCPGRGDQ